MPKNSSSLVSFHRMPLRLWRAAWEAAPQTGQVSLQSARFHARDEHAELALADPSTGNPYYEKHERSCARADALVDYLEDHLER